MREMVDEDEYGGWLRASETVEVRARVRGHIKKVHFVDGDMVKKDDVLFELDPDPFQAEIDQGTAQAKALEAQKVAAEKGRGTILGTGEIWRGNSPTIGKSPSRRHRLRRPDCGQDGRSQTG
jgi:multidrug efflux pump subunit AcrA (membrane-fusion protein)